jgi:hypothetical protein
VAGGGATVCGGGETVVAGGGGATDVAGGGATVVGATVGGGGGGEAAVDTGAGPPVRESGWRVMPGPGACCRPVVVVSVVEVELVVGTYASAYFPCVHVRQTGQSCGSVHCCGGE